jgi:hypothetical protein
MFEMVRNMNGKISKLTRLSTLCIALAGFVAVSGAVVAPSTPANAVVGIRDIDVCDWSDLDWEDMETVEQNAWAVLGWNEFRWDHEAEPMASYSKDWEDLSAGERGALTDLGYDEDDWDDDDC